MKPCGRTASTQRLMLAWYARVKRQLMLLASSDVTTTRTTFTLDQALAEQARRLDVNISAAARRGVAAAVREALAEADRAAYERKPERADTFWSDAEAWSDE